MGTTNDRFLDVMMEMDAPYDYTDRSHNTRLAILLVDDDPIFRKIVARCAEKLNIRFYVCSDFDEVKACSNVARPDIVILDYQLDENETAMDHVNDFGSTPLLLTSRRSNWLPENLPGNFKGFIHKKFGVEKLLEEALSVVIGESLTK